MGFSVGRRLRIRLRDAILFSVIGPRCVMQQIPSSGSKKNRPSRSAPLAWGVGRSRVGGYDTSEFSSATRLFEVLKGAKNHHTVAEIRNAEVSGNQIRKARKWWRAGPIYIPGVPWSAHDPRISGESHDSTFDPAWAIGWVIKSKGTPNSPWYAEMCRSYSNGCSILRVNSIWGRHISR